MGHIENNATPAGPLVKMARMQSLCDTKPSNSEEYASVQQQYSHRVRPQDNAACLIMLE